MRLLFAVFLCGTLISSTTISGDENAKSYSDERPQKVGEPIKVANGTLIIVRQMDGETSPNQFLIHFHGALETTRRALARSEFRGTLIVVNFPGLSSAYSKPFADHPKLLEEIIGHATTTTDNKATTPSPRLILSSFSAGYGAIREILKSPEHFERIDAIVTADSIYAGLDAETPARDVSREDMSEFLRFAELATGLDQAIDQCRFAVINVSDNSDVTDVISSGSHKNSLSGLPRGKRSLKHGNLVQYQPGRDTRRRKVRGGQTGWHIPSKGWRAHRWH